MHVEIPRSYFLMENWSYIFVVHLAVFIKKYVSWRLLPISIWVFNTSLFSWLPMTSTLWLFHNSFNCLDFFSHLLLEKSVLQYTSSYILCVHMKGYLEDRWWEFSSQRVCVLCWQCCGHCHVLSQPEGLQWTTSGAGACPEEPFFGRELPDGMLPTWISFPWPCWVGTGRDTLSPGVWAGWPWLGKGERHWVKRPPGAIRQGLLQPPPQPQQFNHRNEHPAFA